MLNLMKPIEQPTTLFLTTLVVALIALAALVIGVALLANIAGGVAQLLVLILPVALFSHALIW